MKTEDEIEIRDRTSFNATSSSMNVSLMTQPILESKKKNLITIIPIDKFVSKNNFNIPSKPHKKI